MARNVQLPFLGRVIYAFQPQLEGELRLNVGELVLVCIVSLVLFSDVKFPLKRRHYSSTCVNCRLFF